jgi:hypothetical protein
MFDPQVRVQVVLFAVLFEAGLGGLAWGLGWLFEEPPLASFSWALAPLGTGALASLPLLLLFAACVRWPVGPLRQIRQFSDEVVRPWFAPCTILDLAAISLAAGLGEEMLFRGLLQGLFGRWWGPWPGILAASVLFGLLHFITPTYALLAGIIGLYLGWLQQTTGNLLAVVVTHSLYDFVALVWLLRGPGIFCFSWVGSLVSWCPPDCRRRPCELAPSEEERT